MELDNDGMNLGSSDDHINKGSGRGREDDASDEGEGESTKHDSGDDEGNTEFYKTAVVAPTAPL